MPKQRYTNVLQLREPIYDVSDLPEKMFVQNESEISIEARPHQQRVLPSAGL